MNWRTRIAYWLLQRRTLLVVVERGGDDRWRWCAYAPWRDYDCVAQPPLRGYLDADIARKMAQEVLGDGYRIHFVTPEGWRQIIEGRETA